MRLILFSLLGAICYAQQPILYNHATVNAASYAPFGLPNGAIARGSVFTAFGENLGPAQSPGLSFPLLSTLGGVSISVTQSGVVTQAFPIYVSAGQINAVMPSTVTAGLATLRLTYQSKRSNAVTIQITNSSPGIFAVSNGGYGPGVVYNYVSASNQPINSLAAPATPGQVVTIWGTGLGPVNFPDNVAPKPGNVATPVSLTIGGQPAKVSYSGRSPCCAGVDQIVATVPATVPLGCWVPVTVNAGGTVSNNTTMAIAAKGAASCSDPGNPLSALVRTPGSQGYILFYRIDSVENLNASPPTLRTIDNLYSNFYTRPDSPFNFDPYMSYPPIGTCLVQQATGDTSGNWSLRGALPASASFNPQPNQAYNNGAQTFTFSPGQSFFASTMGDTINSVAEGMALLVPSANFTIDPGGENQTALPLNLEPPPGWTRPQAAILVPRNSPLSLSFAPADGGAPTAIVIYSYAAATNSTVQVQCLAPPGAMSFTIPADSLSNLQPTYGIRDGSYANLLVGTLGLNRAQTFSNKLASNGILINANWVAQSVVLQ
jgi:uncharacterized protein (TIGR03437 family)